MSFTSQQQLPPKPFKPASLSQPRIGVDYLHQRRPPPTLYHKQSVRPPPYPPLPVSPRQSTKLSLPPPLVPSRPHPRTVFTSSKPQPLRLVQESLNSRKRKPPVFYAQHTRTLVQSVTYITIHQDSSSSFSPTAPSYSPTATTTTFKMSNANPTMPKLDDNNTDGSSVDSRGRRRRRNKGALQKQGGLAGPQTLPRLADTKPVRLQLGLNLDVELELKARLQGDVSLTLLQ
ncbi:uncharacterized protein B0T23DRAFT_62115 [Neurospora hispaniola]|uniref:Uncharacterized protein n=2 Tax=Neurospora TaxID=5140 RepID=A0AAJ0IBY6_9PEZI|nr:hypothetical protein B0T23DRAFT_62115 [Neurospora hispaniola]